MLEQLCAHSDCYELAIKPSMRSFSRLEMFDTIFNDVNACNRMDSITLNDYKYYLGDMIERGL